ncbi:MAG TPA: hypothetical protein VIS49_04090 [Cyclobacteriaceae bacterium]
MSSQFFSSSGVQGYSSLWNKYRPAILQMMVAAAEGPQTYKFFKHEFRAVNPKEKSYSFSLEAYQGKASDSLRASNIAKDLLSVLTMSPKATELMESSKYEFSLDKQFVLHVTKLEGESEEIEDIESEATKGKK